MDVSMMTDQQLAQMQNNPNSPIPGWLVLAEIAKRREMRQPNAQMPQGTVADKMRQQTQQDMAVAQNEQNADKDKAAMLAQLVQSGQINPGMFAGGSVRGFAGGGESSVSDWNQKVQNLPYEKLKRALPHLGQSILDANRAGGNALLGLGKDTAALSSRIGQSILDSLAVSGPPVEYPEAQRDAQRFMETGNINAVIPSQSTPAAQTTPTPTPTPAAAPAKPNITPTNVSDVAKANKNATSPRGRSPDAETLQNLHAPVQHNDLPEQTNTQTAVQQQSGVDQVESMMTKQQPVSIEQRAKEIQKMLGNDLDFAQLAERISQNDKDLAEEKRNGTLLSILKGVTAAAGSYNEPFAVGGQQYRKGITPALAEGVLTGIQSYETGEKEYRLGKKEVNTALMALQELRHRVNSAATNAALQDAQNEAVRQHYVNEDEYRKASIDLQRKQLNEVEIPKMQYERDYKMGLLRDAGGAGAGYRQYNAVATQWDKAYDDKQKELTAATQAYAQGTGTQEEVDRLKLELQQIDKDRRAAITHMSGQPPVSTVQSPTPGATPAPPKQRIWNFA